MSLIVGCWLPSAKMKSLGYFTLILIWAAFSSAYVCKPVDRYQAVPQSYKIDTEQALYGFLGACTPVGVELDENLQYEILNEELTHGVRLLNSRTGEFSYEPPSDFDGITFFNYRVLDSYGRASSPAKVTIHIRSDPNLPLLEVHNITSVEGTYVPLGVRVSLRADSSDRASRLKVSLCNCNQVLECNKNTSRCECSLTLPTGWVLADGLQRRYQNDELKDLDASHLNLTLKTQLHSHGLLCLDVHAVHWNGDMESQPISRVQHKLHINITSSASRTTGPGREAHEPLQLETREGQVIQFGGLRVRESDDTKGMYRVKVSVDHGGMLSVKQDERSNVIFYPKESGSPEWEPIDNLKEYEQLNRFENFYEHYEASDDMQSSNNGKKNLMFVGSLESINHVLSSMVFVPWCPQWPTPPNWNIPESSWMDPSSLDRMLSDEPLKPAIWPQWFPRFWYPFPQKTWTWWPRVLPPWWVNQTCSDWTSRIHVETQEITPETCDTEKGDQPDVSHWFADVHVNTRNSEPKSLITDNLFTYFPANARSFFMKNLYIRSKEEFFQLGIDLEVVEKELATIRNTGTNRPSFSCSNVAECTDKLQMIEVRLRDGVQDVCKITVEIRMYKDNSERLSDYMMLWGYRSVSECINYLHNDKASTITAPEDPVIVRQGEANIPLGITYSSLQITPSGILHTKIYAEHGLVSVTAQNGLRVYMDNIGQHEHIPTYLCIAGPADMVISALLSATFTPLKNFKGQTSVKIDYRIPSTAMKETFGLDIPPPMKRLTVDVQVVSGERPSLPLLLMPTKVCISEMNIFPLDMMRIEGRYKEDDYVTMTLMASKGQLLLEEQRISEIYECPEQSSNLDDEESLCIEECSYHTACPGTKMCCYQGCSRVCMEPQMVATVNASSNSKSVYMHGKISTLNRVLEAENMFYLPKPCQTHDTGMIVTDRPTETEQDTIRIEIISSRDPEGEPMLHDLSVDVTCRPHIEKPDYQAEETDSEECTEEWDEWLSCELEEGRAVCGRGFQMKLGRCGLQTLTQSRPCLICGCNPLEANPLAPSTGCVADNTIMRCPRTCDVEALHMEERSFSCSLDSVVKKTKWVEVHDTCICKSCLTHKK